MARGPAYVAICCLCLHHVQPLHRTCLVQGKPGKRQGIYATKQHKWLPEKQGLSPAKCSPRCSNLRQQSDCNLLLNDDRCAWKGAQRLPGHQHGAHHERIALNEVLQESHYEMVQKQGKDRWYAQTSGTCTLEPNTNIQGVSQYEPSVSWSQPQPAGSAHVVL